MWGWTKGLNFCPWRCRFWTSAYGIAMAIPRAEVRNSELFAQKSPKAPWNSEFRTSSLGIAMAIPYGEKFGIRISKDISLVPKCDVCMKNYICICVFVKKGGTRRWKGSKSLFPTVILPPEFMTKIKKSWVKATEFSYLFRENFSVWLS